MPTTPSSMLALFAAQVQRRPDAPCLAWDHTTWTYHELQTQALGVAAGLRAWGLTAGERVALALDNGPEFVLAYLGIGWAGGVAVPVNTQYRAGELRHILNDAGAALVISSGQAVEEIAALRPELPALRDWVVVGAEHGGALPWSSLLAPPTSLPLPDPTSLALLVYTSGTTGRAKGVMLTHANLAANIQAVSQAWGWAATDRLLLMLPLFHVHGLGVGLHGTLSNGGSVDLRPRFDPLEALTTLASGKVSLFFGVPTMYSRLLAQAQARPDLRPQGVRLFVSGSAPLSPDVFQAFESVFGQTILERYGMTETGMLTTNPLHGPRRAGTVGRPFPGQAVLVGSPSQPASTGQVGPVWVAGPNIFSGYWQNPEATRAAFEGEWFNTGDLGFLDEAGVLTLVGRARELIITGGFNVYPREVEETLLTHPGVAEAAVIGLPDPDLGERVVAVVVVGRPEGPMPTADDLMEFCRAQLAPYKKPRQVIFAAALPRNAMGKVRKDVLQRELSER
ncbi:MAG: AMP-binding protein [Anaerolineae bacterium]|nr:AMP-binding protein [Anaerolineae bacterium]